jgi:hypothetical protein
MRSKSGWCDIELERMTQPILGSLVRLVMPILIHHNKEQRPDNWL